jgi:hypothetical protein
MFKFEVIFMISNLIFKVILVLTVQFDQAGCTLPLLLIQNALARCSICQEVHTRKLNSETQKASHVPLGRNIIGEPT